MWRVVVVLSVALIVSGCLPHVRRGPVQRDAVWAQPGARPVFVSMVQERTARETDFNAAKLETRHWESSSFTTWVLAIDPVTGASTKLGPVRGTVKPFYWDAGRAVLWVRSGGGLVGLTKDGPVSTGAPDAQLRDTPWLPRPFAALSQGGEHWIYDARTSALVSVGSSEVGNEPAGQLDGSLLRLSKTWISELRLGVYQLVIDWSARPPLRTAGAVMRSEPLDPAVGTRQAAAFSGDGRRYVEVVDLQTERRLVVHDLAQGTQPRVVLVPGATLAPVSADAPAAAKVLLEALDRNLLLLLDPGSPCRRGHLLLLDSGRLLPVPPEACVLGVRTLEGSTLRLVALRGTNHLAYLTPNGRLVDLGENVETLLALGTSAIGLARRLGDTSEVFRLELGTGKLTQVGSYPSSAKLLNLTDEVMVTLAQGRWLSVQRLGTGQAPKVIELPATL